MAVFESHEETSHVVTRCAKAILFSQQLSCKNESSLDIVPTCASVWSHDKRSEPVCMGYGF